MLVFSKDQQPEDWLLPHPVCCRPYFGLCRGSKTAIHRKVLSYLDLQQLQLFFISDMLQSNREPSQCYYRSSSFVNIRHIGYINPAHFSQNGLICEKWCLFTFCPYLINVTERRWKCLTTLVKKNVCVKIVLHANIPAGKAALGRNYFSRHNNFGPHCSQLPSLSCSMIFD